MPDLKTLQYPRWIHHGQHGAKLVQSAAECDQAMDAGWVLSPGDPIRDTTVPDAMTDTTAHVDGEAESRLPVADVPEPDAPVRKPRGRHKTRT